MRRSASTPRRRRSSAGRFGLGTAVAGPALTLALALALAGGGCQGLTPGDPTRITLVNRSGVPVTGVLLKFDREIRRVDRISVRGFDGARLRLDPADTLRFEGGVLEIEAAVTYEVTGAGGPARVVEGRWLVDGAFGAKLTDREIK